MIIDSGATASFIAEKSELVSTCKYSPVNSRSAVRTADNTALTVESYLELPTSPTNSDKRPIHCQFLILKDRKDVFGLPAVVGLDLIKLFNISIRRNGSLMCATIENLIIGTEKLLPPTLSAIMSNDNQNDSESSTWEDKIDKLSQDYAEIFAESVNSHIDTTPMPVSLTQSNMVKARLSRHSPEDIEEIGRQVTNLLTNNIIEPSTSPYSSRAHLVPKKNGQKRLVVNFIPLNYITEKDHYPLPQLSDLFSALKDATYFAALDCTEGFLQIKVLEEHRNRTAFITPQGLFQFKRCPFGFTNSPAKFQRTMNEIFGEGLYKRCVIYIDDILVFGKSKEQLFENLSWVFDRCRNKNIKLKRSKCKPLEKQVEFLGFLLSHNHIAPVPNKCDPVMIKNPKTKKDVLSILGTFNYYARFIPNYTEKTKELRQLVKKDVEFEWSDGHTQKLEQLQRDLKDAIPHQIPDSSSPKVINIVTNFASIEVTCLDSDQNIISRAGHALGTSQCNYTPVEKNLLALILAYEKFGTFLKGEVTVQTTCIALESSLKVKDKSERVNRLLLQLPADSKFSVKILAKDPASIIMTETEHPPEEIFYTDGACTGNGKPHCTASWAVLGTMNSKLSKTGIVDHPKPSNQVAEITAVIEACRIALENQLSHIAIITDSKYVAESLNKWLEIWQSNGWKDNRNKPVVNELILKKLLCLKARLHIICIHVKGHADDENNIKVDQMAREKLLEALPVCLTVASQPVITQEDDEEIQTIIKKLGGNDRLQEKFILIDGNLHYVDPNLPLVQRNRLFVPKRSRALLLRIAHDDPIYGGHLGRKKTRAKLCGYYWPSMQTDIDRHIETCNVCQHNKTPKRPKFGLLQPIKTSRICERIHIDIIGPIKASAKGNKYIITAIDAFSRYAFARPRPDVRAQDIIEFITGEITTKHGIPEKIVSDNGAQFTSNAFKAFVEELGITHSRTTDYHPEANGMDERFNGSLVKLIRNYVQRDQLNWDEKIPWALFGYNSARNETTMISPYTILYSRNPRLPLAQPRAMEEGIPDELVTDGQHEDIHKTVLGNVEIAQRRHKEYYDSKRTPQCFSIFDEVLVRSHAPPRGDSRKLAEVWKGPCTILKIITVEGQPKAAEILDYRTFKTKRIPFQDLKPY